MRFSEGGFGYGGIARDTTAFNLLSASFALCEPDNTLATVSQSTIF